MFELKNNIVKKYDRSIPNINFSDEEMLWHLVNLVDVNMNVYQYLGLLFLRLGFEPEDYILLCNYDKDSCSFDCVLNKSENYRIKFNKKDNQIIVKAHNIIYGYDCEKIQYGEMGMRVSLGSYTYEYVDGMKFTRYLSRSRAKFEVSMCDDLVELVLGKPDDVNLPLYDEHGIYAKYKLDNDEDLIKYLSSLGVLCKSINDIYKELCETYISGVNKYPEFILKRSRHSEGSSLKVVDLIHLKYGKFEKFGMTTFGRTIFLDKDDNWSYECVIDNTRVSVDYLNDVEGLHYNVSYNWSSSNEKNDSLGLPLLGSVVSNEVEDVRKNVRTLFGKGCKKR